MEEASVTCCTVYYLRTRIVIPLAFFVHMQRYVLGRQVAFTKAVIFATAFMCCFTAVIALFKDIPDVIGDMSFGIQSLRIRLGEERVFWLCIKLLLMAYAAAMIVGASSAMIHQKFVTVGLHCLVVKQKWLLGRTVLGHELLASLLWFHAKSVDIQSKASMASCYMFIWKLFYAEYFLIPFMR